MISIAKTLMSSMNEKRQDMIVQLEKWCSVNSGTDNLKGLAEMHSLLSDAFKPIADNLESIAFPDVQSITMKGNVSFIATGNALLVQKRPELKRRILLSGHMDTVYSAGNAFQTPVWLNENQLNGPGVADMKGGLLVMLEALKAFEKADVAPSLGWDVFINADEETGSFASSSWFAKMATQYQAAMVYEPAMDKEGTFAKNRKGSGKFTLIASGKAAHAGRAFYEGRNAIAHLARAVVLIEELNGQREDVTINIGKIAGGEALNVVPDKAVAKLDVRVSTIEDETWVKKQLQIISDKLKRDGYDLTVQGGFSRPVKRVNQGTEKLYQRIVRLSEMLDLPCSWKDSGGCCDGNNLAQRGLPVVDTLGVRGGYIHSHQEYIEVDSLAERAALSCLLLTDLAAGGLEELQS